MDHRRVTLIVHGGHKAESERWSYFSSEENAVAFVPSIAVLKLALRSVLLEAAIDVSRAIVDGSGTADDFLDLLTSLPQEFAGDILTIRADRSGVLSASGRGGDRVLYALTPDDVRFYLEAHGLIARPVRTSESAQQVELSA